MEQMVFELSIFYTLSGLPSPKQYKPLDLTPDERHELQTLYNETVSIAKVTKAYASISNGIPQAAAIGRDPSQGFPHKPHPAQRLKDKGYRVKIIQLEGSKLKPEDFLLGFDKMNSKRSLWLQDLEAGLFKIEKDEELGGLVNAGVTNSADIDEEEEEWGGIPESRELLEASALHDTELEDENEEADLPDENDW
ncbi:uncharacterized protein MELLADRAFT_67897 [Melampsora larici-populina 98AG31]|uniref:Uncharacterized protein n=1 Tax=Melampsora larici-populina (strain 98AG31 / pathotype 3-4-7) TaxID=747676 RepID=F4S4V1_MELLP|nr:uncharacterized protein MELLADRAFT_67897 [Melampsora larici-populina 98AG31]EGG00365.1 hypothetical protein MELLADRAFT_67897 [Melampsora larici-populina 98AG31]